MAEDIPILDLREQLTRIDLAREEALKFMAEQHKLTEEASKFKIERTLYPVALGIGFAGAILGFVAALLAHSIR